MSNRVKNYIDILWYNIQNTVKLQVSHYDTYNCPGHLRSTEKTGVIACYYSSGSYW